MIEWWGPIIDEYYAGSENIGSTSITSEEWLAHKGSVGRPIGAPIHMCDPAGGELAAGEDGLVYFEAAPGQRSSTTATRGRPPASGTRRSGGGRWATSGTSTTRGTSTCPTGRRS